MENSFPYTWSFYLNVMDVVKVIYNDVIVQVHTNPVPLMIISFLFSCPQYTNLPPGCKLQKPAGDCCASPDCGSQLVSTIKPVVFVGGAGEKHFTYFLFSFKLR